MMFRKETEFQETEIGEFPKDWEIKKLREIAKIETGKREKGGGKEAGEVISLGGENISLDGKLILNPSKYISKEFYNSLKSGKVKEKDILLVKDGATTGKAAFVEKLPAKEVAVNEHLFIIRGYNVDQKFLYYIIISNIFQNQIKSLFHGIIGGITKAEVEEVYIPLPPLEEQKRIVDILSIIDSGIETVDRAVAKLEGMKRALLNELLTGRIRVREENGKLTFYKETEFQDTEIGEIPKEWKVVSLEDVSLTIRTGPFGSQLKKSELSESGIKVYTQENVLKNDFSLGNLYISYDKFEQLKNMEVKPGDVLLTIRGSIGYSAVFPEGAERGIIHTNLAYIRVKISLLSPKYLSLLINYHSSIKSQLITLSSATTLGALYAKNIKKIKIPLPPLHEQQKIVEILSMIDKAIELYRKEKERLLRLRRGLMSVLLTGRVRVIGDVRDVGIVA